MLGFLLITLAGETVKKDLCWGMSENLCLRISGGLAGKGMAEWECLWWSLMSCRVVYPCSQVLHR